MPKLIYRVVSACGALGYGYPGSRWNRLCAARSTPSSATAARWTRVLTTWAPAPNISRAKRSSSISATWSKPAPGSAAPVILGSCGMAGGDRNLDWMIATAKEVFGELGVQGAKVAVIRSELDPEIVIKEFRTGACERPASAPISTRKRCAKAPSSARWVSIR